MSIYITVAILAFIAGLLVGGALYSISERKEAGLKLNNTLNKSMLNLIKAGIITKEQLEPIEKSLQEEMIRNFNNVEFDITTENNAKR